MFFYPNSDRDLDYISLLGIWDLEKFPLHGIFLSPKIEKNIISLLYESKSVHYYS